jgi:hypothetical protein
MSIRRPALLALLIFMHAVATAQSKPLEGKVEMYNNRPTLFINNKPVAPQFYGLTHAYGARWSWEENPARNLKNFCSIGFRLYQVDLYFEDIWYNGVDSLDIAKAQRQVRGVLDVCPDAAVVVRIHINAPFWWNEQNRDECTQYADGPVENRTYGPPNDNENGDIDRPLRASLASLKWRAAATEKLKEFCQRLAVTPEGAAVFGLHISCGVFGEWHYWGFPDHDPDTGPAMTAYFQNWLRKKYKTNSALQKAWNSAAWTFEKVTTPTKEERDTTYNGIFRNPQLERRVMDYYECQQYVVAEDVLHFSKVAKESWPRPLVVGVFYNYFFMTFSRQAVGGHLQEQMILQSPYIDYLSAPQSYWGGARQIGGSGQARGLIESALLHGKLWLDEMDQSSYKGGPFGQNLKTTREQDVPIIRRNLAQAITRGAGYWFYDFGPYRSAGWWDDTLLLADIKKQHAVLETYYAKPFERAADVLFVYSNQTFYHIKNRHTPISSYNICDQQSADAFQAGALFDQVYLSDLERVDLKKYKTVVFSNTFYLTEKEKKFIREKVARNGRHIVWNYMPGFTNGSQNNLQFIRSVTGIEVSEARRAEGLSITSENAQYPLLNNETNKQTIWPIVAITDKNATVLGRDSATGAVMVAKKEGKDHTVWFATYMFKQPQVFRAIFNASGAHIYGDGNDVFHEGGGLLMLHTKSGGTKRITLRNGKRVELETRPESTVYLDAATGAVLLQ